MSTGQAERSGSDVEGQGLRGADRSGGVVRSGHLHLDLVGSRSGESEVEVLVMSGFDGEHIRCADAVRGSHAEGGSQSSFIDGKRTRTGHAGQGPGQVASPVRCRELFGCPAEEDHTGCFGGGFGLGHDVDALAGGNTDRIEFSSRWSGGGRGGRYVDDQVGGLELVLLRRATGDFRMPPGELGVEANFQFGAVKFQVHIRVSAIEAERGGRDVEGQGLRGADRSRGVVRS